LIFCSHATVFSGHVSVFKFKLQSRDRLKFETSNFHSRDTLNTNLHF